ncbi:hypothetical protein ACVDG3_20725 [Meridianimarinicoccus sp. RP-17]|uniref:hypothetical protein n=1 Tax=Meridianimarinicoccus zhengii TaxID=2056810 RepID=UPI000DAD1FBB|nr:hypothetical protein [Phycocomes zhengii]
MNLRTYATLGLIGLSLLAGCVENEGSTVTPAVAGGDLNSTAANACRAAIAQETGRPVSDVAVFDVVEGEAGIGVRATVAGADAPWSCQSSPSGQVAGVMYTGSEGSL